MTIDSLAVHRFQRAAYAIQMAEDGSGHSRIGELALTRPDGATAAERRGFFIYLRDLEAGEVWTPTPWPLGAEERGCMFDADSAVFRARQGDVEVLWDVRLDPREIAEWRCLRLMNTGGVRRRLEVTSYLEPVLHHPAADAAHPAFAKLFVQTTYLPEANALMCSRRPRGHGEQFPWVVHGMAGRQATQWETNRMLFIGRGRSLAAPAALAARTLSGAIGNVLDPVLSLRCHVVLEAGASEDLAFYLGAAGDREHAAALAGRLAAGAPLWHRSAPPLRTVPGVEPRQPVQETGDLAPIDPASLKFWNGYGGLNAEGDEYVIPLKPGGDGRLLLPPLPWTNVVSNPRLGFLASETGAGYTWSRNSRQHRLTPWYNDPVLDPHGEAFYLRDADSGDCWSPLPGPVPGGAYEARHGFGYSRWSHESHGLNQEVWQFVDREDPVKITRLRLANRSGRLRKLALTAFQQLVMAVLPEESRGAIATEWQDDAGTLLAHNSKGQEFADGVAFSTFVGEAVAVHYTTDRLAFLGHALDSAKPQALACGLDGHIGTGQDACFALQADIVLRPGETLDCAFLLGETSAREEVLRLVHRYRQPGAVEKSLEDLRAFWRYTVSTVRVETPVPAIDLMMNGWLAYQNLSCRLWGRSAFYQSGGAYGYRDQLQDAAALLHLRPDLTRTQILLNAGHQFVEGDVLHWWHPEPLETGLRTRFADDLLWLPLLTAYYARSTGDWGVLDERAPYVEARLLEPGEDEAYIKPGVSVQTDDVYGHCCRAIDRALAVGMGVHGLPLFGTGDWNDGMSRVGREGRGESVWMGFFLFAVLGDFLAVCERRDDQARMQRYKAARSQLQASLEAEGWDGDWYRRAYYDDGAVMGSKASDECQIDALAQAWAVISGAAPPGRAAQAMDAVECHLISERDKLVRLLTPPFESTPHDPGYIKGYVKGVRENGGQYTHAACWVARAMAELGRHERAAELLEMLSPISHSLTPEQVGVYQVEPYVIAADIYGAEPHVGRGGWTWYTGSAGWYYRVVLESLLGIEKVEGRTLRIRPRIPASWPGFKLDYRLPDSGTAYAIQVTSAGGGGVTEAELDGMPLAPASDGAVLLPLAADGHIHRLLIRLVH